VSGKSIDALQKDYESALEATRKSPKDDKAHARSITAAQKLADARQAERQEAVARGERSDGFTVTAEDGE
jgi:hypothetical protein